MPSLIDTAFDFRSDSKGGDPDSASPMLRKYHKILWNKRLPNGDMFSLSDSMDADDKALCYHNGSVKMRFSSDWIINTYLDWERLAELKNLIGEDEYENFNTIACTMGGYIIFPLYPWGTSWPKYIETINVERGKSNGKINDRFDLTLECIRRFYAGVESPLADVITKFDYFFQLFGSFKNYCEFFLLQDLVSDNYSKVKNFMPPADIEFNDNPHPKTVDEYRLYEKNAVEFVNNRNKRINEYCNKYGQVAE